jgi:hypothetical protein
MQSLLPVLQQPLKPSILALNLKEILMRKFLIALPLMFALGGCAGLASLQTAFNTLTGTTVTSQTALTVANSYDAIAAGATVYLSYCKTNLSQPVCSSANLRSVIKNVQLGRALRNQVEGYVTTSTSVPVAVYNALEAIVTSLGASPAANFSTGAQ